MGLFKTEELLKIIRDKFSFLESEKFIQELAWRGFLAKLRLSPS
jgi:hypothetical protein